MNAQQQQHADATSERTTRILTDADDVRNAEARRAQSANAGASEEMLRDEADRDANQDQTSKNISNALMVLNVASLALMFTPAGWIMNGARALAVGAGGTATTAAAGGTAAAAGAASTTGMTSWRVAGAMGGTVDGIVDIARGVLGIPAVGLGAAAMGAEQAATPHFTAASFHANRPDGEERTKGSTEPDGAGKAIAKRRDPATPEGKNDERAKFGNRKPLATMLDEPPKGRTENPSEKHRRERHQPARVSR